MNQEIYKEPYSKVGLIDTLKSDHIVGVVLGYI